MNSMLLLHHLHWLPPFRLLWLCRHVELWSWKHIKFQNLSGPHCFCKDQVGSVDQPNSFLARMHPWRTHSDVCYCDTAAGEWPNCICIWPGTTHRTRCSMAVRSSPNCDQPEQRKVNQDNRNYGLDRLKFFACNSQLDELDGELELGDSLREALQKQFFLNFFSNSGNSGNFGAVESEWIRGAIGIFNFFYFFKKHKQYWYSVFSSKYSKHFFTSLNLIYNVFMYHV